MRDLNLLIVLFFFAGACVDTEPDLETLRLPSQGGRTSILEPTSHAYTMPSPGLSEDESNLHLAGDKAFEDKFVSAPSFLNPGLGPTFNNNSCNGCHIRNGRGMPVSGHPSLRTQILTRVSMPDGSEVPGMGHQIQDFAILGAEPEARVDIAWEDVPGSYADGTSYMLRRPIVTITPTHGDLPDDMRISLRQPPPIFGLGLLEAVPEATLLEWADPADSDGDGISGRKNTVRDQITGKYVMGRFGWKANEPNLLQQSAEAYRNDMGIGSPNFPDAVGDIDITQETLDAATFYAQSLAVPERRGSTVQGFALFQNSGCAACHRPTLTTDDSSPFEFLRNQEFAPFTDMLLHDMGDDLADNRPDGDADGREWRTSPLWGIGLTHTVVPDTAFLHDGRARTLEEAILWHGGEAVASRDVFKALPADERARLLSFVMSL